MTSNKLSDRLIAVKKKLGLTLIRFEDAAVELEIFKKEHAFESSQFLINAIWKHYKDVSNGFYRHFLLFPHSYVYLKIKLFSKL